MGMGGNADTRSGRKGSQYSISVRAAWARIPVGLAIAIGLPLAVPATAQHLWLLLSYVGFTLLGQLLVWRRIGDAWRPAMGGMVDLGFLTFLVHRLGSVTSTLVSLYIFVVILYALATKRRVAMLLAIFGSVSYMALLVAEYSGILPYAPDAPQWSGAPVTARVIVAAGGLLAVLMIGSVAIVGNLVHLVRDRERQLEAMSRTDSLTGLANRRYLLERLSIELARVRRGSKLALLMIDLDGFKRINDSYGHLRGDEMLIEMADALRQTTRETDVPARYGGDEFAVLLPDTDLEHANAAAERLVERLRETGISFEPQTPVTASVGLAIAHAEDTSTALLQRADENGYQAKRAGGDRLVVNDAA